MVTLHMTYSTAAFGFTMLSCCALLERPLRQTGADATRVTSSHRYQFFRDEILEFTVSFSSGIGGLMFELLLQCYYLQL